MNDLVSVIMPLYNSEKFVLDAIESVLLQTYQKWELIVVDDCSTDNSAKLISGILDKDSRVRFVQFEKNMGPAQARNAALELARGRFFAFLDSDDIWHAKKIETQVRFMLKKGAPISFTSYELIDEDNSLKNHVVRSIDRIDQVVYLKNTIIGFSTSMIDTAIVGSDFRMKDIRTRQDASLWITLLGRGFTAYGIDEILTKYRVHPNSISANKLRAVKQVWNLYFNLHNLGFFRSIYYCFFYALNAVK